MVAHAGLVATLLLPVAVIFLPAWAIEAPAALPAALAETASYARMSRVRVHRLSPSRSMRWDCSFGRTLFPQ
jgi:hypothetical protein